jgi:poly-beta-1,6-N-acetyl-D-glucosamine synthase
VSNPTEVVLFWLPLVLVCYNWLGFPLLLGALGLVAPRRRREGPAARSVTVLVAAYNEELVIDAKLRNALGLETAGLKLDVLVGSDGSTDRTDEIVRAFGDDRVGLVRLEVRGGKPAVLNALVGAATGDLLLFTDADVMLKADALKIMAATFTDPRVGAVHPHYERVNDDGSPAEGFFDRYESWLKNLEGRIGAMVGAYGWALMVRRSLCASMPEDTILDDFLIGVRPFRKGYDVVYERSAYCWTRVESERVEFRRKVRISRGNVQMFLRNPGLLSPRYGLKAWVLFSHKFLRWVTPFLMLLMLAGSIAGVAEPAFRWLLAAQILLYATTPLAVVAPRRLRKILIFQYYVLQNVALLVGYWQYFFGQRRNYWQRTSR